MGGNGRERSTRARERLGASYSSEPKRELVCWVCKKPGHTGRLYPDKGDIPGSTIRKETNAIMRVVLTVLGRLYAMCYCS